MSDIEMEPTSNWKTKTYIIGAVTGALLGIGTAFMLSRSADERGGGPPKISTGDFLKIGVAVIGLVRGIAALGD